MDEIVNWQNDLHIFFICFNHEKLLQIKYFLVKIPK